MIDRLPDELVLAIFEELAAERVSGRSNVQVEDKDVQHTLVSACRVSRRLRKIAQPVLWRRVVLGDGERFDELLDGCAPASLGLLAQQLVLKPTYGNTRYTPDLDQHVATTWPNIVELAVNFLRLRGPSSVLEPVILASHNNLRRLTLTHVELVDDGEPLPDLPHLVELGVMHCHDELEILHDWVVPSCMPSLGILHVAEIVGPERYATLDALLDDSIITQLDVLRTGLGELNNGYAMTMHTAHKLVRSVSPPVLIDYNLLADSLVRHTLFLPPPPDETRRAGHHLFSIAEMLEADTTVPPAVLVFPRTFLEHAQTSPYFAAGLQGVEAQCAVKGARIIWYDGEDPFSFVPPEFVRYARELKAERRAREEDEQEVRA